MVYSKTDWVSGAPPYINETNLDHIEQGISDAHDLVIAIPNARTADYTLVLTDLKKSIEMNVATANNLTVPPNSSVAFPVGAEISIVQIGNGQTTIVAGAGVTVNSLGGSMKIAGQYGVVTLRKRATDSWLLYGDVTVDTTSATKTANESAAVTVSDVATVSVALTNISASDTGAAVATESRTLQATQSVSDTGAMVVTDTRTLTAQVSTTDTGGMAVSGASSISGNSPIVLSESFETGANGAQVTNSNTAFTDGGNGTTDGTWTFTTADFVRGSKSTRILNPTLGGNNLWKAVSSPSQIYRRIYFKVPTVNTTVLMDARNGSTSQANVQITSSGFLRIRQGTTTTATFTYTLSGSLWYRMEEFIDVANGTHTGRIFYGANLHGSTPDEEITGAYTGLSIDRLYIGTSAAVTTLDLYIDEYAHGFTGWIGAAP